MSYIVTGGAGFVGSNMVKKLNEKGITDIIIIDSYGDDKMKNLLGLMFKDFVDYQDGLETVGAYLNMIDNPQGFFHIGANAEVLVYDPKKMMNENDSHGDYPETVILTTSPIGIRQNIQIITIVSQMVIIITFLQIMLYWIFGKLILKLQNRRMDMLPSLSWL